MGARNRWPGMSNVIHSKCSCGFAPAFFDYRVSGGGASPNWEGSRRTAGRGRITLMLLPSIKEYMRIQNCLSCFVSAMCDKPASVWRKPVVVTFLGLLLQSLQATPLLQEGFNYPAAVGNALAGNGTWLNSYSYITVGSNSLIYPSLVDTLPPGYEVSVLDNPNQGSATTAFYTYSPFTSVSSGTVYAAFLLDYPSMTGSPNYTFMGLLPTSRYRPRQWRDVQQHLRPLRSCREINQRRVFVGDQELWSGRQLRRDSAGPQYHQSHCDEIRFRLQDGLSFPQPLPDWR